MMAEVYQPEPLPERALNPMTSVHPAVCAWRVRNGTFGLSLAEIEAVCFALIEREEERRIWLEHASTADWALMAGRF